jgi:hypothetical protein
MRKPILAVGLLLGVGTYVGLGGSGGCGGGSSPASSSSSGAFGVVTVNGKQKLYLPLIGTTSIGNGQIAVVDVGVGGNGVSGAKALITDIDLGSTDIPTCTAGTDKVVVAAGTGTYKVWFIDPSTDTVSGTLNLDPTLGNSNFSGTSGLSVVTGIAIDPTNNQAILSIWNGFAYVDLTSKTVTSYTSAAPSENFGFDSTREMILAPFYACSQAYDSNNMPPAVCATYLATNGMPMVAGFTLIRLVGDAGVPYVYQNPDAGGDPTCVFGGASACAPFGTEPDSASVDTSTGLAVIPDEGSGVQYILDLSHVTYDDATKSFTAPVNSSLTVSATGVAIESSSHIAFWESEHSSGIAAVNLNDAYNSNAIPVSAQMPSPPAGDFWSNLGDPHGVAVTTGIQSGNAVGFVVNDQSAGGAGSAVWVARIDLQKLLSLTSGADISPAVTFLDATTKE